MFLKLLKHRRSNHVRPAGTEIVFLLFKSFLFLIILRMNNIPRGLSENRVLHDNAIHRVVLNVLTACSLVCTGNCPSLEGSMSPDLVSSVVQVDVRVGQFSYHDTVTWI